jgi:hypothetical protein
VFLALAGVQDRVDVLAHEPLHALDEALLMIMIIIIYARSTRRMIWTREPTHRAVEAQEGHVTSFAIARWAECATPLCSGSAKAYGS